MKHLICVIAALAMMLLAGCAGLRELPELPFAPEPSIPEYTPEKPGPGYGGQAATYYNACLGLSMRVLPQDYIVEINAMNLGMDEGTCATLDDFDWEDAGEGYQATLLIISSGEDSSAMEHAGMWMFAEYYPAWTFDEYIEGFGHWLDEDTADSYYTLETTETVTIGGRDYTRFLTRVDSPEGYDTYYEEYYVTPAGDCYLIVEVDYWLDSSSSYTNAMAYLERFSLDASMSDAGGVFNA